MKSHYIRMKYQFELHQVYSIHHEPSFNKHQNDYYEGFSKCSSKWFLIMVLTVVTSWVLERHLLALKVCQLCGAHSNGVLGSFLRKFWKIWRTKLKHSISTTSWTKSLWEICVLAPTFYARVTYFSIMPNNLS